jgi:hypothetical protein
LRRVKSPDAPKMTKNKLCGKLMILCFKNECIMLCVATYQ